eukprot:3923956-Rhodomonas_salina.2
MPLTHQTSLLVLWPSAAPLRMLLLHKNAGRVKERRGHREGRGEREREEGGKREERGERREREK